METTNSRPYGWLALAIIPAALGGGALMWLAFYTGVVDWREVQRAAEKTHRIEGRMDERVGVRGELVAPVDLVIRKTGCLQVSRAFLDDGVLTAYVSSSCHGPSGYWEWHWNQVSPDGTILATGYRNSLADIMPGETIEVTEQVKEDARTLKIVVWSKRGVR
jgi:hypothetical protein